MTTQVCTSTCPLAIGEGDPASTVCPGKARLERALRHYFPKFSGFRPGQLEALLPVIHGRDVFVRMATGSGKSLCIFLAPLAVGESAVGVVISPLNALMEQQVRQTSVQLPLQMVVKSSLLHRYVTCTCTCR